MDGRGQRGRLWTTTLVLLMLCMTSRAALITVTMDLPKQLIGPATNFLNNGAQMFSVYAGTGTNLNNSIIQTQKDTSAVFGELFRILRIIGEILLAVLAAVGMFCRGTIQEAVPRIAGNLWKKVSRSKEPQIHEPPDLLKHNRRKH